MRYLLVALMLSAVWTAPAFAAAPKAGSSPRGKPNTISAIIKDDLLAAYEERGKAEWLRGLNDRPSSPCWGNCCLASRASIQRRRDP
jgi:hypothetical protein